MIVAAIDIGTNSTRLLVAEVDGGIITEELYRQSVITRLGRNVNRTGRLNAAAVERTLEVLRNYAGIARSAQAAVIKAVATSAMRDADNAADLLVPAFEIFKVMPEIIAGEGEAALTYRGVMSDEATRALGTDFLVIDIGGGSTEIVFGDDQRPESLNSLPLGCVRLTEAFFKSDPPPPTEITALRLHVRLSLEDNFSRAIGASAIPIAVAGTPTSLAAIELKLAVYDRDRVHRYKLTRDTAVRHLEKLASLPL
ncbi:MAG: hypothetical protein Q8K85_02450, partial [Hyphomicrobium sp.]|nr:hypothetical protein [Hyphomicrobium sp.]